MLLFQDSLRSGDCNFSQSVRGESGFWSQNARAASLDPPISCMTLGMSTDLPLLQFLLPTGVTVVALKSHHEVMCAKCLERRERLDRQQETPRGADGDLK